MSKLLKKYYETKKRFRTEKVIKQYKDTLEWSKALNEELEKILSEMNSDELYSILENTQGMYRTVIKQYLDRARVREAHVVSAKEANHSNEKKADDELAVTIAS